MPHEEEEVAKNPAVKKEMKVIAAEVEKTQGRGQVKVGISCLNIYSYIFFKQKGL